MFFIPCQFMSYKQICFAAQLLRVWFQWANLTENPVKIEVWRGKTKKKKKGGLYSARETFLNWILCCALQGLFFSFFPFHLKLVNLGPVVGKEGFAPLDLWVYYEHGRVRLSAHWWMLHLWADYQFKHLFTHKTKQNKCCVQWLQRRVSLYRSEGREQGSEKQEC